MAEPIASITAASRPSEKFGTDSSGSTRLPYDPAVTVRRSSYRSLVSLQRDNGRCRACAEAGYPLESLPVFEGRPGQRAYMLGQAPGIVEGEERRPWRGRAGQTLRRWLELDEDAFYETFYCASVTRCYPGRPASGRGDRTPTPREQQLCAFWREWELRLLRPSLIVTVGGMAARRLLGEPSLACIGRRFERHGELAIQLPHPRGASGWLHTPANHARTEDAQAHLRCGLALVEA
jgi:DNA polymerase